MANAQVTYVATGSDDTWAFSFTYLDTDHVKLYLDGVEDEAATFPTASSIQASGGNPAADVVVLIARETPRSALITTITNSGSIRNTDINNQSLQAIYCAEEARDQLDGTMSLTADDVSWDGDTKKIVDILDPTLDQDAATKKYVDDQNNLNVTNAAASADAAAADAVSTAADVVSTNADVVLTNADVVLTNADVVLTNADVVLTNADVVSAAASAAAAAASQTALKYSTVSTRTLLKALDTTSVTTAYLTESGRRGTFIYKTGDYSTEVSADTQEGLYIKADAIATTVGAWVRDYHGALRTAWFGEVCDDATNDAPFVQAAFDVAPAGATVEFTPTNTYNIQTALTVADKALHIRALGAKIHFAADIAGLNAANGVDSLQAVTAVSGATVTVTDGTDFIRGDLVKVVSDDVLADAEDDGGATERYVGEMGIVKSVAGNVLTLHGDLYDAALFSTTKRAFKVPDKTFSIEGGEWYYTTGQSWNNPAITIVGYVAPSVSNMLITRVYGAAVKLSGTYGARVENVELRGLEDDGSTVFGYGILDMGTGTTIDSVTGSDCRHVTDAAMGSISAAQTNAASLYAYGRVTGGRVTNCTAFGCSSVAFNTHHGVRDYQITGCYGEKSTGLLSLRGWDITASNNSGRSISGTGCQILTQTARIATEAGYTKNVRISDLDIECDGAFILTSGGARDVVFSGYMRGVSLEHRSLYLADTNVVCYADIDLEINDTVGTNNADGALMVRDTGVSYPCSFTQYSGRIAIDGTGDTGGTNKTGVRAVDSTITLNNFRMDVASDYDVMFETATGGVINATGFSYAVDGAAESTITLENGSNITTSADSDDATNDSVAADHVENLTVGRVLTLPAGEVVSGTYTPTLTDTTNVSSSSAYQCNYIRVGNMVTVAGRVDVTPTAAASTSTRLDMSLPIASNFGNSIQCAGTASAGNILSAESAVFGTASGDRAIFLFLASSTSAHQFGFQFTYEII